MRRWSSLLFPVALVLVAFATGAVAEPRIGISAFAGYQSYTMGQINDAIDGVKEALSTPGRPANIDNLNGDVSFGGAVKADFDKTWRAYFEYEYLKDSSGYGNSLGSWRLKPNANAILVGGTYFFPSTGKTRLGLGAGVGYYAFGGSVNSTVTWGTSTSSGSHDLGGSTVGLHGRGEIDVMLSPVWHFDGALGYRWAKGGLDTDGNDSGIDLDWSGLMTRVGFTYFVN
jgi:hypothetical protein